MRKRLSKQGPLAAVNVIAVMSLFTILTFSQKMISLPFEYGVVEAQLPVVPPEVVDSSILADAIKPAASVKKNTPTIVMTDTHFFFGKLEDFTTGFARDDNKFVVSHRGGEPQILELFQSINKWKRYSKVDDGGVAVFLPSAKLPMPIVIQVIHWLQKSPLFEQVIIASGLT